MEITAESYYNSTKGNNDIDNREYSKLEMIEFASNYHRAKKEESELKSNISTDGVINWDFKALKRERRTFYKN